jgi:hypothetical protein
MVFVRTTQFGRNRGTNVKITFVLPGYADHPVGGYKVVYEYANNLVRNGHAATIVYLQQLRKPSSHHFPLARSSWLGHYPARLAYAGRKPKITWYNLHRDVKLVNVTDLETHRVPNADAIFATAWQTASRVNECPTKKGTKSYLVMDFPPWLGDKYQLEQTWRLPLKKIAISS